MDDVTQAAARHSRKARTPAWPPRLLLTCASAMLFAFALLCVPAAAEVTLDIGGTPVAGGYPLDLPVIRLPVGGGVVFGQNGKTYTVTVTATSQFNIRFLSVTRIDSTNGTQTTVKIVRTAGLHRRVSYPISITTSDSSSTTIVASASDGVGSPPIITQRNYVFKAMSASLTNPAGSDPVGFTATNAARVVVDSAGQQGSIPNPNGAGGSPFNGSLYLQTGTFYLAAMGRSSGPETCPQNTSAQICLPLTIVSTATSGVFDLKVIFDFDNAVAGFTPLAEQGLTVTGVSDSSALFFAAVPLQSITANAGLRITSPTTFSMPYGKWVLTGQLTTPVDKQTQITCDGDYSNSNSELQADFNFNVFEETPIVPSPPDQCASGAT
jgi:hypothetical protein